MHPDVCLIQGCKKMSELAGMALMLGAGLRVKAALHL